MTVPKLQNLSYDKITMFPKSETKKILNDPEFSMIQNIIKQIEKRKEKNNPHYRNKTLIPLFSRILYQYSGRMPTDRFAIINIHDNGWYTVQSDPGNYAKFRSTWNGYEPFELGSNLFYVNNNGKRVPRSEYMQYKIRLNPVKKFEHPALARARVESKSRNSNSRNSKRARASSSSSSPPK
tara:strand:- start:10572 stop:11114 length:543 start_codon:yes stop_codon:yes gene_type:complete